MPLAVRCQSIDFVSRSTQLSLEFGVQKTEQMKLLCVDRRAWSTTRAIGMSHKVSDDFY